MNDSNYSFASLFDKTIPFDYEISKNEIERLVENHKVKYPRDVDEGDVSKRKFTDYLERAGMPKWEIQLFQELKNVEGWVSRDSDHVQ